MSFFDDFNQLRLKVSRLGLQCVQNENSPFCQYTEKSKNCYMTFASYESEDCYYNHRVFYCRDCTDTSLCYKCELCYECIDCINSYNCNYCIYCEQATDSEYCLYCIGVQNCFGCVGLTRSKFCIFNQQFSEEEYKKKIEEIKKSPKEKIFEYVDKISLKVPRVAMYGKSNENTYGENIHHCKNVYWGFDSKYIHDGLYIYHCDESKNLVDCSHLGWSELYYEIMSGGGLNNCSFCYGCWDSRDLEYCELLYNSRNCFGCVGLNHAKFCILNKKYTEEEYTKKVKEIEEEMGKESLYGKWFPSAYDEVITYGL